MKVSEADLGDLIRVTEMGRETCFEIAETLDGTEGKRLVVEQRQIQPEPPADPDISRAKARDHEFHSIDVFGDYLTEHSLCLADVDEFRISAVLDESSAEDREIVSFMAKLHPQFLPWYQLLNRPTEVRKFALHCMTHRRSVVEPDGRDLTLTMSQVKASKSIEQWSGVGNKSVNGIKAEVFIGSEKKGVPVEIPESIVIQCPIFIGAPSTDVTIDLLVDEHDGQIIVYCTSTDYEEAKIASFESFVETLQNMSSAKIGFGKIKHRKWDLVRSTSC